LTDYDKIELQKIVFTSLKLRQNYFLKFDFVIISLKTTIWTNHATSGQQN